jgi:membrane-associated phospholipid phosphatase
MDMIAPKANAESASDGAALGSSAGSSRKLFVAAAMFAGLAAAALAIDLPVAHYVNAHGLRGELARVVRLSEVFGWGGTVTLLILTAGVLDGRGWRIVFPLAASALGSGLIADGIKLLIARWRPSSAESLHSVRETFLGCLPLLSSADERAHGHAIQSFPSAHAATAAGLAAGLSLLYPRGRWLFAAFAALAMLQRIEGQAHWCSDVLAGAAIGCCVAAAVVRFSRSEVRGRKSSDL